MSAARIPKNGGNADFTISGQGAARHFGNRAATITIYGPRGGAIGTVDLSPRKALRFARELLTALCK